MTSSKHELVTKPENFILTVTNPTVTYVITNITMTEDEAYIRDIIDNRSVVAYRALVEKYENRVFTLCYKIVKGREEAEEVAQDTFVLCFKKLTELKELKKFPNWLMKIAYSKAIDHVRKKHIPRTDLDAVDESHIKDEQTPLKNAIVENRKAIINRAINELEPVEASVITLYYIQDIPIKEIAEITGLTLSNVKVKLFRARHNLKVILSTKLKDDLKDFIQD